MERLQAFRSFFADLLSANAGIPLTNTALRAALAFVPREQFVGPGPWRVFTRAGYIQTPSDDPAFLYQDFAVAIAEDRQINNGQPLLHVACLAALNPKPGESAIHIGAGTGYYTALLANLVGSSGSVDAYEIEQDLAERAAQNLSDLPWVRVHHRSGTIAPLPSCDLVYVSAGATAPLDVWLDALCPGGRLLFPLTPAEVGRKAAPGGMLLIKRSGEERFDARFVCPAAFIACSGARDQETGQKLSEAFRRGDLHRVRSLHRNSSPDDSSWVAGNGWWLSTAPAA